MEQTKSKEKVETKKIYCLSPSANICNFRINSGFQRERLISGESEPMEKICLECIWCKKS